MGHRVVRNSLCAALMVAVAGLLGAPTALAGNEGAGGAKQRVVVFFHQGTGDDAIGGLADALSADDVRHDDALGFRVGAVPAAATDAALHRLKSDPSVDEAELDATGELSMTPNDPYFPPGSYRGGQWGFTNTSAATAWDTTTGSSSTVVAIIDSGIAPHPDLSGRLLSGYNVLDGSTNATDTLGHGTEAAGVAVAASNNGAGIAGYCWQCSLLPVKVTNSASVNMSDVATGIRWAADHGARIISLSLNSSSPSSAVSSAVAYARQKGDVVIAAAGNNACDCPQYPAADTGVISVAGTDYYDAMYSWSNYGSWVDVAAPGQNLTTALTDPSTGAPWGYVAAAGTSFATPAVAGEAGLLVSANPSATGTQIEDALRAGVDPLTGSKTVGGGRIDIPAALAAVGAGGSPPPPPPPPPPPAPPATTTTPYSGSLNQKTMSQSYAVSAAAGPAHATLSFSKCSSMTLTVLTSSGTTVASATGPSTVSLDTTLGTAGSYVVRVTGSCRTSFSGAITVNSPT